jgi:hypothetical protein
MFAAAAAAATATVTYKGQGFNFDGTTYNLNDERCGAESQGTANDGSTGQFANWNGPGQPYQTGQPYLVWVLTANGATSATITLPAPVGTVNMIKVGGTFKYASRYSTRDELVNLPVKATYSYSGKAPNNVQLVVSHGCAPFQDEGGAWCSPGYWKNAADAAWALTGYAEADHFNLTVVPSFYDTASGADPTLETVLNTPGANTFGAATGPLGLNAFNATGAFLTNALPGYAFSLDAMNGEENELTCPIDNHGNWKKGTVFNP